MASLTEKDLFSIFVEFNKSGSTSQPKLQIPNSCARVNDELKGDALDDNQATVIENLIRKYRTLKTKHHKKHGYNYIIENASNEIQLTKAKYEEGPSPTKKQKTIHDEKPAHRLLSLL